MDAWGIEPVLLEGLERLEDLLAEALEKGGVKAVTGGSHQFDSGEIMVWAIADEGHATIRVYPEEGRWMADVFSCGDLEPEDAVDVLVEGLGGQTRVSLLSRG